MRRVTLLCAATWATSEVGFWFFRPEYGTGLVWPVIGVAMVWFWTAAPRRLPWESLLLLAVIGLTLLRAGADFGVAAMAGLQVVVQVGVTLELMRRLTPDLWGCGGHRPMQTLKDLGAFLVAALVATTVATVVRAAGVGLIPLSTATDAALVWVRNLCWLYLLGAATLTLAPLLAHGWRRADVGSAARRWWPGWAARRGETLLVVAASLAVYVAFFTTPDTLPLTFVLMLPPLWAALRLSPPIAIGHALASALVAIGMTLAGHGNVAAIADPRLGALVVQALAVSVMTISLTVSLVTSERVVATSQARLAERRSAERATLLSAVLEQIREGILVLSEDGSVLLRNSALSTMPGAGIDPGLGDTLVPPPVFDARGTPLTLETLPHARALAGEEVIAEQLTVRDRAGEDRVLEISATPLSTLDGEPRALVTLRDVTTVRQREDALAGFAGIVAHDLNNPLTVVGGWADTLAEGFADGHVDSTTGARMVARIQAANLQMRRMIDDLLVYAVARDQPLRRGGLDLSALAEEVASLWREDPRLPRVVVQPGIHAYADAVLVRQLLDNLIGNAVKYVAAGSRPEVTVSGRTLDSRVEVSITDNGIGVKPADRERIFDTFTRGHVAGYRGTGIGLGICHQVVRRHGGDIWVEPGPDGHGSRFVFTVPARPPGTVVPDQRAGSETSPGR